MNTRIPSIKEFWWFPKRTVYQAVLFQIRIKYPSVIYPNVKGGIIN